MTEHPEKKIIVDEDWKSQVNRERDELRASQSQELDADQPSAEPPSSPDDAESQPEAFDANQLPPASFGLLVSTMATQALAAMGQLPDPISGMPEINLSFAKYHIDLLAVLQQKTSGNLSGDEAEMLEGALHQLRMAYVQLESAES